MSPPPLCQFWKTKIPPLWSHAGCSFLFLRSRIHPYHLHWNYSLSYFLVAPTITKIDYHTGIGVSDCEACCVQSDVGNKSVWKQMLWCDCLSCCLEYAYPSGNAGPSPSYSTTEAALCQGAREAVDNGSSTWVPATHSGELDGVPGSWLRSEPAHAAVSISGSKPVGKKPVSVTSSLCLPSNTKKIQINIF